MLLKLKEHTGCENVVTFGSIKRKYDVYICDAGVNATVKLLIAIQENINTNLSDKISHYCVKLP